jgi:hypothetical protein
LTALFWSNINPYGTFRLDMNIRPNLSAVIIPGQREPSSDTVAEDVSALAQQRLDFKKEDHAATPVAESAFLAVAESWLRERARQSPA